MIQNKTSDAGDAEAPGAAAPADIPRLVPGTVPGARAAPSGVWRMLSDEPTKGLPKGFDAFWDGIVGQAQSLLPRTRWVLARARRIVAIEKSFAELSDARLREEAYGLRDLFRLGREKPQDVDRGMAIVREVGRRKLGLLAHPVQVAAALAMHDGCVAELSTGEGKTLSATMPATLAGWRGRGCHILTVNDYLAKRDATDMRPIYEFCGLSVAHLEQAMPADARRTAYHCDLTYGTNKEAAADYLRDRLAMGRVRGVTAALLTKVMRRGDAGLGALVQRGLAHAIVDEADSILIDEAVTPLIISSAAGNEAQSEAFAQAAQMARALEAGEDYKADAQYHEITFTSTGTRKLDAWGKKMGGIWSGARRREELITQALTAREFYYAGKQYITEDDKAVIVDEFTGRLMPDREWRDGLHQAVQAKEGLTINAPKETLARISFQRFFRLYHRLSGMTATAWEARQELWQIYRTPVVRVPTHQPCIRTRARDRVYATPDAKWSAVVETLRKLHATGQPVLVGTRNVRASEHLAKMLTDVGLEAEILNAVRHAEEAQVVAGAGNRGRITVATNMAGRGTDIKLDRQSKELGGLFVLATERHESGRVDRQLFGRSARQGDPGAALAIVCLDDELLERHAPVAACKLVARLRRGNGEVASIPSRLLVGYAQWRAQRAALRQRKQVLKTDTWLDEVLGFAGAGP